MKSLFPKLFEPIQIGGVRLRNRIFSSGHMTCMLSDGLPNADFVAYHEARAAGGCGLAGDNYFCCWRQLKVPFPRPRFGIFDLHLPSYC